MPVIQAPIWDKVGSVYTIRGARVKIFDCVVYNNFYAWKAPVSPPNGAKVLHFKGHKMHRIHSYSKEFLGE
jgi:aminopeptidase-like protein